MWRHGHHQAQHAAYCSTLQSAVATRHCWSESSGVCRLVPIVHITVTHSGHSDQVLCLLSTVCWFLFPVDILAADRGLAAGL